jgi:hypothetical protein
MLYKSRDYQGEGSTIVKGKTTGRVDYEWPALVECRDFADWLLEHAGDNVVVKMNVEGAEYVLLPHLAERGALTIPRYYYISWHEAKLEAPRMSTGAARALLGDAGYALCKARGQPERYFEAFRKVRHG